MCVEYLYLTTHGIQITESTIDKSHLSNEMSSPTEMPEYHVTGEYHMVLEFRQDVAIIWIDRGIPSWSKQWVWSFYACMLDQCIIIKWPGKHQVLHHGGAIKNLHQVNFFFLSKTNPSIGWGGGLLFKIKIWLGLFPHFPLHHGHVCHFSCCMINISRSWQAKCFFLIVLTQLTLNLDFYVGKQHFTIIIFSFKCS